MKLMLRILLLLIPLYSACSAVPAPPTATPTLRPTPPVIASAIPVTNAEGEVVAEQPGFVEWVLLSGVDEHGLVFEHMLILLEDADPNAPAKTEIHTGHPVIVHEIRHVGPQNLQRFYRIETITGTTGWISDFYVRRRGYLFNYEGTTVPMYDGPGGEITNEIANVTPITLLEPRNIAWWKVSTLNGDITGWVQAAHVKESPEEEFLLGSDHQHNCVNCPYFFPSPP